MRIETLPDAQVKAEVMAVIRSIMLFPHVTTVPELLDFYVSRWHFDR